MKKIYALLVLSLAATGCALIGGGGDPDPRWADYKSWTMAVSYTHLTLPTICSV